MHRIHLGCTKLSNLFSNSNKVLQKWTRRRNFFFRLYIVRFSTSFPANKMRESNNLTPFFWNYNDWDFFNFLWASQNTYLNFNDFLTVSSSRSLTNRFWRTKLNNTSVISPKFINKFVQNCQCYYMYFVGPKHPSRLW